MESETALLSSHKSNYGTESQASTTYVTLDGSQDDRSLNTYPLSDLISSNEHLTKAEINHNIIQVKLLSITTLIMTCILTIVSFIVSQDSDSSAAYGFAFDSFLAGLTSSIILWRFWSVKGLEHRNRRRELIALFAIVISLIITGVLVGYRAIKALVCQEKQKKSTMLLVLAAVSLVLYLILFILKYRLAKRLGSRALRTDSIDALCGAILSLSIVISTATRKFTTKAWFLDPVIALGVAIFSMAYGAYSVVYLVRLRKEYREFTKETESSIPPSQCLYLPQA